MFTVAIWGPHYELREPWYQRQPLIKGSATWTADSTFDTGYIATLRLFFDDKEVAKRDVQHGSIVNAGETLTVEWSISIEGEKD